MSPGTSILILIPGWLFVAVCLWLAASELTKKYSAEFASVRNLVRIGVRSLVLALIFAPSVYYFFVGFVPAPASFILAWYAFFPSERDQSLAVSRRISFFSLLATWVVLLVLCARRLSRKVQKDR